MAKEKSGGKSSGEKAGKSIAKKSSGQIAMDQKGPVKGTHRDIQASEDKGIGKKRSGGSEDGGYSAAGKNK